MSFGELVSALLGWLGDFVRWLCSFVPRYRIVRIDQLGVRYVRGRPAERVEPGVWWYWPWCTEIDEVYSARQSFLVPPITVEASDGVRIAIGCAVVYRIVDPIKYRVENFDADTNMGEVAMAGLREIATSHASKDLSACTQEGTRLGDKLARRMGKDLEPFGVEVLACRPTEQVRLDQVVRVFGLASGSGTVSAPAS